MTVQSGESLATRVEGTALVERHRELGEDLLVWVVVLVVPAAALSWWRWRELRATGAQRPASSRLLVAGVVLIAVVGMAGTMVQIVRIGHSGAEAAWSEVTDSPGRG